MKRRWEYWTSGHSRWANCVFNVLTCLGAFAILLAVSAAIAYSGCGGERC